MNENKNIRHCLNCNNSENDIPLVSLVYTGNPTYLCSRCLPLLIHHPEKLIGKIDGAENILPAEHDD